MMNKTPNYMSSKVSFVCIICSLLVFAGCKNRSVSFYDGSCTKIDLTRESDTTLVDYIKTISLIPVEREDFFIYYVSPLIAAVDTSFFYMVDSRTGLVSCIKDNKVIFSRRCIGRGPGEFQELGNIFIKGRELGLYDRVTLKAVYYDETGKNTGVDRFEDNYLEFFKLSENDGVGLRADATDTHSYISFINLRNKKNKRVGKWNELEDWELDLFTYPSCTCMKNGTLTNYIPYHYYVYKIDSTKVTKQYYFDFVDNLLDDAFLKDYSPSNSFEFSMKVFFAGLNGRVAQMQETNDYYFLIYIKDSKWESAVIDKKTDNLYSTMYLGENERYWAELLSSINFCTTANNNVYGLVTINSLNGFFSKYNELKDNRILQLKDDVESYKKKYELDGDDYVILSMSLN